MTMRTVSFNDAYKGWRNRARKYHGESVVRFAMRFLQQPATSRSEDLQRAPWQILLMVKWVCQDRCLDHSLGQEITPEQFQALRMELWDFPSRVDMGLRDTLPGQLFFRQLINPQSRFQRRISPGFVREAAFLAGQEPHHPLRTEFAARTGIDVRDFMDLAIAAFGPISQNRLCFNINWFSLKWSATTSR